MPGWDYTTTELLKGIRRASSLPDASAHWTDAVLLAEADRIIRGDMFTEIISVREEFSVYDEDYSIVANQGAIDMPDRTYNGRLRDVLFVTSDNSEVSMARVTIEDLPTYLTFGYTPSASPVFAVKESQIILAPTPTQGVGTIRFRYYKRPSKLIATTAIDTIATVNSETNVITDSVADLTTGTLVDVYRRDPTWRALACGVSQTNTDGNFTFASAVTGVAVGDFVAFAGETHIPPIPPEMHSALELGVAAEVLRDQRSPTYPAVKDEFERRMAKGINSITPRVDGAMVKTINRYSPLRVARTRYGGRGLR